MFNLVSKTFSNSLIRNKPKAQSIFSAFSFHSSSKLCDFSEFFDSSKGWSWSEGELKTGRGWSAPELRQKDFADLHSLWWTCLKERNKLESQKQEARRFKLYFPHSQRMVQVKSTMARIKHVLWERRMAWLQAQEILKLESSKTNENESSLSVESDTSNTPDQVSATSREGSSLNETDLESSLKIARMGRKKAPMAKVARIRIKKGSRPTHWTVV